LPQFGAALLVHRWKFVRTTLRGADDEIFHSRNSSLAPWFDAFEAAWSADCYNGAQIWLCMRYKGFDGSLRVAGKWATRRRPSEQAEGAVSDRLQPARIIVLAMLSCRSCLTAAEASCQRRQ